MSPNRDEVRAAFVAELQAQGQSVPAELAESYVTLLMGMLRRAIPPAPALGPIWQDQAVAWVVRGIRGPLPPQVEMEALERWRFIGSLFQQAGDPVPPEATLKMLARMAAWAVDDRTTGIPAEYVIGEQAIAETYRDGND
jgi:hypothetical protein